MSDLRLRVLVITNLFPTSQSPYGGIFVTQRLRALERAGLDVTAVAPRPILPGLAARTLGAFRPWNSVVSSRIIECSFPVSPTDALALRRQRIAWPGVESAARALSALLDDQVFDLIHAHGMYGVPAGAVGASLARRVGIPYVVTLHGSDVNCLMPRYQDQFQHTLSRADALAFVSRSLYGKFRVMGGLNSNVTITHNGIDSQIFNRSLVTRRDIAVAFVGNLTPIKGVERLPEIFTIIQKRDPTARFVVVGGGPLRQTLAKQLKHLDVEMTGPLAPEGVAHVMRRARVLVMPSRNEGWPCIILEAHSTGTPVVAADVGGVAEALGSSDLLVPEGPHLTRRLADMCWNVLREPPSMELRAQRAHKYDWGELIKGEIAMYEDVIAKTSQ